MFSPGGRLETSKCNFKCYKRKQHRLWKWRIGHLGIPEGLHVELKPKHPRTVGPLFFFHTYKKLSGELKWEPQCWGGRSTHCLWYSAPMLSRCCQGNRHSFCWRRSISASLSSNAMHRSRRRTPSGCHWDGNVLITDSGRPNCWAQDAYITSYGCVRDFLNSFGRLRPIVPISLNENQRHREVQWLILGRYRCQTTWDCIKAAKRFYPKIFTNSAVITRTPTTCSWEWAALSSSVCSPSREKSWLEEMHLS